MTKRGHICPNAYRGEGARGACYVELSESNSSEEARLDVGWSCVVVHQKSIPVSWLAELVAIATAHKGGIAGFLREHDYGSPSYALMCNPPEDVK